MWPPCFRHWLNVRKRRLKAWFRDWVIEEESNDLEVRMPGHNGERVTALAPAGTMMHVRLRDGQERLISSRDAVVEDRYWRVWKRLGGGNFSWPDGTKFDPTEQSP